MSGKMKLLVILPEKLMYQENHIKEEKSSGRSPPLSQNYLLALLQ